jgi:formate hydrogenlyase subunit 3/multisubunit Na+/H+ antiporter MnhD subunit
MTPEHAAVCTVLLVAVPLGLALVAFLAGKGIEPIFSWIAPLVIAVDLAWLGVYVFDHGPLVYEIGGWTQPLGIAWSVSGLQLAMLRFGGSC